MRDSSTGPSIEDVVQRVFSRFTVRYGVTWLTKYPPEALIAVQHDWERELSAISPWQINWALDHLADFACSFAPNAGEFVSSARQAPKEARPHTSPPDANRDRNLCAWTVDGQRCQYPGSQSSGTKGEGPWYCRGHYDCASPTLGAQIVEQSHRQAMPRDLQAEALAYCRSQGLHDVDAMRDHCRQAMDRPTPKPSAAWLDDLIARHNAGIQLLPVQIAMVNRALQRQMLPPLNTKTPPGRQMGED